ncbi:uncharacterized protein EV420DRAFT_1472301 [Desarmillaria tabescens]|uniref:Uncharacterized protein n=1 Tax=Armillaria tabescens TaxID=1929756 RepID=A0AA39NNN3_ARMTA|nr:uncharacterized protein EV420DRAFT_1472301 [Desarmillaria tabescens]KAK0468991.1 hypothetical protein EV420DRAFT_1472301 [Desarmillaria tabescens]
MSSDRQIGSHCLSSLLDDPILVGTVENTNYGIDPVLEYDDGLFVGYTHTGKMNIFDTPEFEHNRYVLGPQFGRQQTLRFGGSPITPATTLTGDGGVPRENSGPGGGGERRGTCPRVRTLHEDFPSSTIAEAGSVSSTINYHAPVNFDYHPKAKPWWDRGITVTSLVVEVSEEITEEALGKIVVNMEVKGNLIDFFWYYEPSLITKITEDNIYPEAFFDILCLSPYGHFTVYIGFCLDHISGLVCVRSRCTTPTYTMLLGR